MSYQEERNARAHLEEPDWRGILDTLSEYTPEYEAWLDKALSIIEPEDADCKLLDELDSNIWDIAERHGSLVTLGSRDEYEGKVQCYFLSGPPTAIRDTAIDVLRVSPRAVLKIRSNNQVADSALPDDTETQARNEMEAQQKRSAVRLVAVKQKHKAQIMRADKMPWPEKWTPMSFADFVTDLTSLEMPNQMHNMLYKDGETHADVVLRILRTIFLDPACTSSISRKAVNAAMMYYVKSNKMTDLKRLFVHLETMGIDLDVSTYNIMFSGVVKTQDLHVFHFLLHMMVRHGVRPNAKTWVALLMTTPDIRVKLYILSAMRERGLLRQITTLHSVCAHLVPYEIDSAIENDRSNEWFIDQMDSRYGRKWLTLSNANAVLNVLGSKGLISRCWEFLQSMKSRSLEPDAVSYSTIVHHCKTLTNVDGGIEIMKELSSYSSQFNLDQRAYDVLFELAWQSKSYNLARVVWRYACLNAFTTRRMRYRVRESLSTSASDGMEAKNPYQRWKRQAGLFITGDNPFDRRPLPRIEDNAGRDTLDTQLGEASSCSPDKSITSLGLHLAGEYSVFGRWRPAWSLIELLLRAREIDKEWSDLQRSGETQDLWTLSWKLERGICVPVRDSRSHSGTVMEAMWV